MKWNHVIHPSKQRLQDFSALRATGTYVVFIPGIGHSYVFDVRESVHNSAAVAGLKGYYYQRASMPLV